MATITARTETFLNKNALGQWANKLERQANEAMHDLQDKGIATARAGAPVGDHSRPSRTGIRMKDSIREYSFSGGGEFGWATTAKHFWWYVLGTTPHRIVGKMVFFWSNAGTWYVWNKPGFRFDKRRGSVINHPGTKPHDNFLLESFRVVAALAPSYMRRRMG